MRAWELLEGPGALPQVVWTRDCLELEEGCAHGMHRDGEIWVQVRGEHPWETSLTHELLHALYWRETGDGNQEFVHSTTGLEHIRIVNWILQEEFCENCTYTEVEKDKL